MLDAPIPADDEARLSELHALDVLDTAPEERFDRIVRAARTLLDVPIALVSLVDRERQWFKARAGLETTETPRSISFCGHAILGDDIMEIDDASADERFADNPMVTGEPGLRFYAGVPLRSPRGYALGTLCVIDRKPRRLSPHQRTILRDLGAWAELVLNSRELETANELAGRTTRQLRSVLDSATDAIIVFDDSFHISTFNKAAEHMFGRNARELRGRALSGLLPPGATRDVEAAVQRFRRPHAFPPVTVPQEVGVERADGTKFVADMRISINLGDEINRYTMIVRDITESHMAFECLEAMNRKIAESLSLQQAILDGTNHAIVACGTDGRIVMFNAGAERMLGYSAQEMLFRKTPLVFHDAAQVAERAQQLSQRLGYTVTGMESFAARVMHGETDEQEWTLVRRDGSTLPVLLSLSALRDDNGQITGSIAIAHDLTEAKRLDSMKADFVATVSHELRTPLTSIKGAVQIMAAAREQLPPAFGKLLDIADKNCARLATMVNDILDLEKIERRKMVFDCQPQSLAPVVRDAVRSVQPYADGYGVRVQCRATDNDAAFGCMVDAGRLTQVMVNLLSNAIKFSPRGAQVDVVLTATPGQVRFAVVDRGPGIPDEFRDRIFEKFAQAGHVSARSSGGSGLGLAICKAIIEHHEGRIGFDSVYGEGSTFYFELPCCVNDLPEGAGDAGGGPEVGGADVADVADVVLAVAGN